MEGRQRTSEQNKGVPGASDVTVRLLFRVGRLRLGGPSRKGVGSELQVATEGRRWVWRDRCQMLNLERETGRSLRNGNDGVRKLGAVRRVRRGGRKKADFKVGRGRDDSPTGGRGRGRRRGMREGVGVGIEDGSGENVSGGALGNVVAIVVVHDGVSGK